MLSDGDGPFGVFRRWARQFYAATTGTDRTVIDRWEPLSVFDVTSGARPVRANGGGAELGNPPIAIVASASSSTVPASQASETNGATIADLRSDAEAIQATFFERLPASFNPTAAAGREFVIQYDVAGDGGGKYFVEVRNGTCSPAAGEHPAPTVRVLVDAADWLKINTGTLNRAKAFMTGRLKVQGDMALAIKLGEIFPH